jgi:DNA-binding MurR/RpiR family transcriptional regulator
VRSDDEDLGPSAVAPREYADLCQLISERQQSLPKRLAQVAAYAFAHPDEIAFGTAASISESAGVQPSTLVRFAQALGYQGFSDLQEVFRSRLRDRVMSYDERMEHLRHHDLDASRAGVIWQGFREASERSLADLDRRLDHGKLDAAVEMLAAAETIYVVGLRRSLPISTYCAYAFGKLGVRSTLVSGLGGLAAEQVNFATKRDAMLAISFTPYASETVALASDAARRRVPIVAITDGALSPLADLATLWLEVSEANFDGFRSQAATLALAMTLTVAVAQARND